MEKEIKKFIGEKVTYDRMGQYFWGHRKGSGGQQMVGELRGWGAIQNLFKNNIGQIDTDKAAEFQDAVGEWIADAINQKLNRNEQTIVNKMSKTF